MAFSNDKGLLQLFHVSSPPRLGRSSSRKDGSGRREKIRGGQGQKILVVGARRGTFPANNEAAPEDGYRICLPRQTSQHANLLLIQRTWGIMKQQHSTLNGKTQYVMLFDKFFEELETKPQSLMDLFGSSLKERGRTFDTFVFLTRSVLQPAEEKSSMLNMVHHNTLATFPHHGGPKQKRSGMGQDPIQNKIIEFGIRSFRKGVIANDLLLLESAIIVSIRAVVYNFVGSAEKRAQIIEAWGSAVQILLKRMIAAYPTSRYSTVQEGKMHCFYRLRSLVKKVSCMARQGRKACQHTHKKNNIPGL